MAFPSIESINPTADSSTGGAATSGSTAATSHSVVLPATISAGSLLAVFGRVAAAGTVAITGGGWTITQDSSDASDDVAFWAYRDTLADGTEDGTSITITHGSAKMNATTVSITGAANPATRTPESSTVAIGTSTTPNPTTATPTGGANDYLWLWFGSWDGEQTLSKTQPTNYTDRADVSTGTGGIASTNVQLKVCDRTNNAASEDPGTITLSGAPTGWTAWTIAIHPVPSAVGVSFGFRVLRNTVRRRSSLLRAIRERPVLIRKGFLVTGSAPLQIALNFASEADTAQAFARLKIKTIGQPSESDTAQAFTRFKRKTLGQPSENDSAQTVTSKKNKTLGVNTETDLAQTVARSKVRGIGLSSETSTAQTFTGSQLTLLGQVVESDSAFSITPKKARTVGQPVENDTAFAFSKAKAVTIGQITETDTAQPFARRKIATIGQVLEADEAASITRLTISIGVNASFRIIRTGTKRRASILPRIVNRRQAAFTRGAVVVSISQSISTASETDTALSITRPASVISQAIETDAAQTFTTKKTKALGLNAETDTSQSFARRKSKAIGLTSETDTSQTFTRRKSKSIGQPFEVNTSQTMVGILAHVLNQTTETDTSQPFTRRKIRSMGFPTETNASFAFNRRKLRILGQPFESDLSQAIKPQLRVNIITENDTAFNFTRVRRRTIGQPSEVDSTFPFVHRKRVTFSIALESNISFPYIPSHRLIVNPANETDSAFLQRPARGDALGVALEFDTAQDITTIGVSLNISPREIGHFIRGNDVRVKIRGGSRGRIRGGS